MSKLDDYSAEAFIDKLYKDLHASDEVKKVSFDGQKKKEKLRSFFEFQDKLMTRAINNGHKEYLYKLYHDKYCFKTENIQGMSDEEKSKKLIEQEESLDSWLNYLLDENVSYPMWYKYLIFQKMLRIGNYDEASDVYKPRRKDTYCKFIECNPEAIAQIYNLLSASISGKKIDDENLNKLINNGSIDKLYILYVSKLKNKNLINSTVYDGKWIKYNYGSVEDAKKLCSSLQGKNTGWCTAGEQTAIDQVCGGGNYSGGDFHVYYTKDKDGNYTLPRIAIRMGKYDANHGIGEIRGIDSSQNLEDGLENVVKEKLDTFLDLTKKEKEKYILACNDAKMLSYLNKKCKNGEKLTIEEIYFIYENERKIEGFGWKPDERISLIREKNLIEDKSLAMDIVNKNGLALKYVSKKLRNDREVVLTATIKDGSAMIYASKELRNDREFIYEVINKNAFALIGLGEYRFDHEIVTMALNKNGHALRYVPEELRNNREIVLTAVNRDGCSLEHASKELRNDREIVLAAIKQNGYSLKYASKELQNDREIVLEAVKQNGYSLEYASEEFQNDREIVLAAVKQNGYSLEYASEEFQNDREIVLEAVKEDKDALAYAGEKLRNDREIVMAIVKKEIEYWVEELQNNRESFIAEAKEIGYDIEKFQNDYEFIKTIIKQECSTLKCAGEELRNDQEFVEDILDQSLNVQKH